jgi:mRNA-degrading endonuclease RelE of RelBE toxin-antitoxin system
MAISKAKKARKKAAAKAPSAPAPLEYKIQMTDTARAVYSDLYKRCKDSEAIGDITSYNCSIFRMVREAIKTLIPHDPVHKRYALSGDLSNIFRLKKGRLRICWVASTEHRTIIILFISDTLRKEGDARDPYELFAKMVMTGAFNEVFGQIGVRVPTRSIQPVMKQ